MWSRSKHTRQRLASGASSDVTSVEFLKTFVPVFFIPVVVGLLIKSTTLFTLSRFAWKPFRPWLCWRSLRPARLALFGYVSIVDKKGILPPSCIRVSAYCSGWRRCIVGLAAQYRSMLSRSFKNRPFTNIDLASCSKYVSPHISRLALWALPKHASIPPRHSLKISFLWLLWQSPYRSRMSWVGN